MKRLLVGTVLLLLAAQRLPAQSKDAERETVSSDSRVKAALDRLGLKYKVSDQGNFLLTYDRDEGRTQLVVVNSVTTTYGGYEIREVSSTAYRSDGPLSADLANKLLDENDLKKLGAWVAYPEDGSVYVDYKIQLPATADDKYLRTAIEYVMDEADDLEKELTQGKDEF